MTGRGADAYRRAGRRARVKRGGQTAAGKRRPQAEADDAGTATAAGCIFCNKNGRTFLVLPLRMTEKLHERCYSATAAVSSTVFRASALIFLRCLIISRSEAGDHEERADCRRLQVGVDAHHDNRIVKNHHGRNADGNAETVAAAAVEGYAADGAGRDALNSQPLPV